MICAAGGTRHEHDTVAETREHWDRYYRAVDAGVTMHDEHPGSESRGADRYEEQWDATEKAREMKNRTSPLGDDRVGGPPEEPGVYFRNDQWYLVVQGQSGHLYAKVLQKDDERKSGFFWAYARGAIRDIRATDKATPEQAAEWGMMYHFCVKCLRPLARGESMRRGYGPDCAKNHGWPYNHSSTD